MSHEPETPADELPAELRAALADLRRTPAAPPELEAATVAALHRHQLLRRRAPRATGLLLRLAAALALVAGGWLAASWSRSSPPPAGGGETYALLLWEDAAYRRPAPGHEGERAAEYSAWAGELHRAGIAVSGSELAPGGEVLAPAPAGVHREPPAPGPYGSLAGFFLIAAADRDQALDLARECPHLRYGGRVEVRALAG